MEREIYLAVDGRDGEVLCAFTNKKQCIMEVADAGCQMQTTRLLSKEDAYTTQLLDALKHMLELTYKFDLPSELSEEYANAYANYSNLIQEATL